MSKKEVLEFFSYASLLAAIILYMILLADHKIKTDNILLYIAIGLNSFSFILMGIYTYFFGIPCDCSRGIFYSLL